MVLIPTCRVKNKNHDANKDYTLAELQQLKEYTPEKLQEIKIKDPENDVFDNLICSVCGIPLEFKQGSSKRRAHLSTWPNTNHKGNCDLIRLASSRQQSQKATGTINTLLSSQDQLKERKYLLKKIHHKITPPKKGSPKKRRRKVIKTDQSNPSPIYAGTSDPKKAATTSADKKRKPRSNFRIPGELDKSVVGKSVFLYGILSKVNLKITGNRMSMNLLVEYNNESETIYSSPDFFNSAHVGLIDRIKALRSIVENKDNPEVTILIDYIPDSKKGEARCTLYDESNIRFPLGQLGVYLNSQN
ncbi:hypothetical protein [Lactiplantibacillus plantarum]|uniref:hypothetical protein n=1 Tax=Lactiplantibacillus plantarum TaxID=1590 RepID=UPI000930C4BF|nr:hypothetical protein [Lactiplantibacillus plantarum]